MLTSFFRVHVGVSLVLSLFFASFAVAQLGAEPPPEVAAEEEVVNDKLPLEANKTLELNLSEATWLALDVAPDGQQMVIEVLGDLYLLPITGGTAEPLLTGMAFDSQPRFSPDGTHLAFISDRGGSDDVWILDLSTDTPRKLSASTGVTDMASPSWSPDGTHVVVSQSSWSLRTFEVWAYPVEGGTGVQMTKAKPKSDTPTAQRHNALGPTYDESGRYLYYAAKRGGFGYKVSFPLWQIARKDLRTGLEDTITAALGSGISPRLSPNGKWLVFGTRHKHQTGLRIRNLATGEEEWLAYPIQRDEQESRFTRDLLPGYAFSPDSKALYTVRNGKIARVDIDTKSVTVVPFAVQAMLDVRERLSFENRTGLGPVKARVLAEPQLSPDGAKVAFATLGRIYVHEFESNQTTAMSPAEISAGLPAWSPDGKHLAYAAWSLGEGALYRQRARAGAKVKKLTPSNGYFSFPTWTPDGKRIVALRGLPEVAQSREYGWGQTVAADVVWLDAKGSETNLVVPARGYSRPHFGPEADRIYLYIANSLFPSNNKSGLMSVRFDGTDRREHLASTGMGIYSAGDKANAETMAMSPTGEHVLLKHASQLYIAKPLSHLLGQKVSISKASVPLHKLTDVGADFATWSADGETILWTSGDQIYQRGVASIDFLAETEESADEEVEVLEAHASVAVTQVDVYLPRAAPEGTVALTNARLITMGTDGVIERGTIVIENNRISAVGASSEVELPAGIEVIDLEGRTISPGFIDTHAHYRVSMQLYDRSEWGMLANLAYGVTTGMDVQPSSIDMLDVQDRIDAGLMLGPRAFSTGPGVFSNNDFKSKAHAEAVLRRYKERYRVNNIKAYISGSRQQRHWLIQAAEELKLMPTTEGGLDMKLDLTHAIDGFSGLEHAFPIPHLFEDVVQLAAQTRIAYTPTLLVNYGGPSAENWFYTNESPYLDEKLRRFMPYRSLAQRSLRKKWFQPGEYVTDITASSARKVVDAGGQVGVGAHGQLQGLGYHWELWSLAAGGFDNLAALRAATLMGAQMLGLATDLGSIEVGKLADLAVMAKNPLDNIRHTSTLSHVVINGEVYEADTLNQVWPEQQPLPEQWWWQDQAENLAPPALRSGVAQ